MKKLIFIITTVLLFSCTVDATEWEDNMTSNGIKTESTGACINASYDECFVFCQSDYHASILVQLVYYDGATYQIIGSTKVGNISPYIIEDFQNLVPGLYDWQAIPSYINSKSNNYAKDIKNTLLHNMASLFDQMGLSYIDVMNQVKAGKYPKHQRMGSNGVNTTGVRLLIQPLFMITGTSRCPNVKGGISFGGTLKSIIDFTYNKRDWNPKDSLWHDYLWLKRANEYSNRLKLEQSDIGYTAYSWDGNWDLWRQPKSGYGIGILSPFNDVEVPPEKCDPGYNEDSIKACCKRWGITDSDRSKNTSKYMTRTLTNAEVKIYCTPPRTNTATPNCDYKLKNTTVNNCLTPTLDNRGNIYTDKDNSWPCIFRSPESKHNEVKTHYDDMGTDKNDYCHLYCTETIKYEFPEPGVSTYSGRYLVVGESIIHPAIGPVKYTLEKECRTTDKKNSEYGKINYDQFELDMEINERKVVTAWDNYRTWQTKQTACNNAKYNGTSTNGAKNYTNGSATYNGKTETCSYKLGNGQYKPNYTYQINNAYKVYSDYIKKRNEILGQIGKCNSHVTSESFDPSVKLTYEEPVYGDTVKLESVKTKDDSNFTYYKGSNASAPDSQSDSYKTTNSSYKYFNVSDCKYDNCKSTRKIYYKSNTWVKSTYTIQQHYKLPDNMYLYVNKYSGQSFNDKIKAGSGYLTMPVSNLPIHYSTKPGDYDFKLETSTFESTNKLEKYAFKGSTFANKKYQFNKEYDCKYNVSCKKNVIKDQSDCEYYKDKCPAEYAKFGCGSGFIFRPVSLNNKEEAFPGQNGDGRTPGGKWDNNSTIYFKLTNARGVEGYDIYKESPMYEVTLTPALIKEIRKYNKEMNSQLVTIYENKIPSIGVAGYTSLNGIKCESNSKKCISQKIRDWKVDGCAIKGHSSSYTKCDYVSEW